MGSLICNGKLTRMIISIMSIGSFNARSSHLNQLSPNALRMITREGTVTRVCSAWLTGLLTASDTILLETGALSTVAGPLASPKSSKEPSGRGSLRRVPVRLRRSYG